MGCSPTVYLSVRALTTAPRYIKRTSPYTSCSVYADDICLWTSATRRDTLKNAMQPAIDTVVDYLDAVGLNVSKEKTAYMILPHPKRRSCHNIKLNISKSEIQRVKVYKFLGVTLDPRLKGKKQADRIAEASTKFVNAIRRIGGLRWGNAPRSMLGLHTSLVVSRMIYALPFTHLSDTQKTRLERIHRRGLRTP